MAFCNHANAAIDSDEVSFAHSQDCDQLFSTIKEKAESHDIHILANDDPVQIDRQGNNLLCKVGLTFPDGDGELLMILYFHKNSYLNNQAEYSVANLKKFKEMLKISAAEEKAVGIEGDKVNPPKKP